MSDKYIVAIGGLNMDIAGISGPLYKERDSNIGKVYMTPGGVGRNIAHNLRNLEAPVDLISVYGDDNFGDLLKESCQELGIGLNQSSQIPGKASSVYLYVTDGEGDMVTGVNAMEIIEEITPEFLEDKLDHINGAQVVVIDANISRDAIEYLAKHVTAPIFAEPVSTVKSQNFLQVLDKIDTIKPNEHETEVLTGVRVWNEETAQEAADILIAKGVKNVFISMGVHGVFAADKDGGRLVPILPTDMVSANGAGDSTMATLVWARYHYGDSLSKEEVAMLAQAAASITLESASSVSDQLSIRNVVHKAQDYYN